MAGIGLVLLGLVGLLVSRTGPAAALQALATALLLLAGSDWSRSRGRTALAGADRAAARADPQSEERAEIAAHVHDSVLQTLTLIQRNAADAREVTRLARTEERALRSWLYAPEGDPSRTFAAALQRDAAEVEVAYSATIDVVTVGDAPIDAALGALLAATREAMVNAAKHGGGRASVYAEVDDDAARCSCATEARLRSATVSGGPPWPARIGGRPDGAQRRHGGRSTARRARVPRSGCGSQSGEVPVTAQRLRVVLVDDHAMVRSGCGPRSVTT